MNYTWGPLMTNDIFIQSNKHFKILLYFSFYIKKSQDLIFQPNYHVLWNKPFWDLLIYL